MQGTHLDRSKKTIGVMALMVLGLVVLRLGCNNLGFAKERAITSSSLGSAGGAPVPAPPAIITRRYIVTAYCPCEKCCGKWADGITASGHAICPGDIICAADPSIPFGTRIFIPGYSAYPVRILDRGGDIKGNRLDVLFYDGNLKTSHARALEWGVQYLECKVYE